MHYTFDYIVYNKVNVRQRRVSDVGRIGDTYVFWEEINKFLINMGQIPPPNALYIETINFVPCQLCFRSFLLHLCTLLKHIKGT